MDLSILETPGAPDRDHSWLAGDSAAFSTAQSCTLDVSEFTSGTHYDADTKVMPAGVGLTKLGSVFVPFKPTAEVQTLTISGTPTGGSYKLSVNGEVTAVIAYNADAATIQAALEALSNVAPGDVTVTGTGPFTLTFGGAYYGVDVPTILLATNSLTGGSSPTVTIATTAAGGAQTLDGFTAYPVELLREDGTTSDTVITSRIVDATIIPANLPVTAQRSINRRTPTTGKFGFVS